VALLWKGLPEEEIERNSAEAIKTGRKSSLSSFLLSQGSFIVINCALTPAYIQIDLSPILATLGLL
jgi:hypothetical protein